MATIFLDQFTSGGGSGNFSDLFDSNVTLTGANHVSTGNSKVNATGKGLLGVTTNTGNLDAEISIVIDVGRTTIRGFLSQLGPVFGRRNGESGAYEMVFPFTTAIQLNIHAVGTGTGTPMVITNLAV